MSTMLPVVEWMPDATAEGYDVLAELISPVHPRNFFQSHYERRELIVNRSQSEHHRSILTLDDIDHVITELNLGSTQIRLVNGEAEEPITASDYLDPRGYADPRRVFELFEAGATIILPQLNRVLPKLGRFCAAMETVFTQPFQTNVYMTPPGAQGFKVHYDTHDVFIVQAAGSKNWTLYEPVIELPLRGQPYDSTKHEIGESVSSFRLECGDTAYLPRGVPHDARSTSDISLHITVGVLSQTWADFILDVVSDVCLRDPELRQSLPPGYAGATFDRRIAEERCRKLLDQMASQADFAGGLSGFVDEFIGSRRPLYRQQLGAASIADRVGLDQALRRRDFLVYNLEVDQGAGTIHLKTYGLELSLPLVAQTELRHALSAPEFTPRELPGELDEEGRLTLAQRLVREGLVTPVTPS